ncbi:MAG: O-antigen ligase family protein [Leptospirillia bacterium]
MSPLMSKLTDERLFYAIFSVFVFNLPFSEALKETFLVLSFLLVLLHLRDRAYEPAPRILILGLPVFLFTLSSLLSALHSLNTHQALRGFWGDLETLMSWVVFSGAFLLFPDRARTFRISLVALATGLAAGAAVGLYKMIALGDPNMEMMNLGDKNSSAQFISTSFLLFLGAWTLPKLSGLTWKFFLPLLLLLAGSLLLCHARAFLISIPVASAALLLIGRHWKILGGVLAAMAAGAGLLYSLSPHLQWEMASVIAPTKDGSFTSRYEAWAGALQIFHDHPLLGIGPDTFQMANIHKIYRLPDFASHGHNIFFNLLAEYGLLGVISFALILFVWSGRILRDKDPSETMRLLKGMTVGFLLNLLLAGLAHPMWGGSFSLLFMFIMAYVLVTEERIGTGLRQGTVLHSVPVFRRHH